MPEIVFDVSHVNVKLSFDEFDTVTWFVLLTFFDFAFLTKLALTAQKMKLRISSFFVQCLVNTAVLI